MNKLEILIRHMRAMDLDQEEILDLFIEMLYKDRTHNEVLEKIGKQKVLKKEIK